MSSFFPTVLFALLLSLPALAQEVVVLGIAQDAGYPQMDCDRACCQAVNTGEVSPQQVASLGIICGDTAYLVDATPDITEQWQYLKKQNPNLVLGGIFLTHAHIGHYTGLMYLGREAMGARNIPVYVMPRMQTFLESNGPWSQLVELGNIRLVSMQEGESIGLTDGCLISPVLVPHRDEFSETVGYLIRTEARSLLYIPDIDKWSRWDQSITAWIEQVDYALLDGTFYDGSELPNRNMDEIPHPFVVESLTLFKLLDDAHRGKVHFIHFNHTNPLVRQGAKSVKAVESTGMHVVRQGNVFNLSP